MPRRPAAAGPLPVAVIYPTNAVAKRWVAHQVGFLPDFADEIVRSVAEIRSAR